MTAEPTLPPRAAGQPRVRDRRDVWGALRAARWVEPAVVIGLLVAIQVAVFAGYYAGVTSPSGDFLASYNSEAFAWWREGGILNPPDWVPYTWGGFPAASQIQNSSWYLPVGVVASLVPFDITAAASLQALHVALGGAGMYVLVRRAGLGRSASTFALVAYSFTTGFFTEAPYVDIVRGFALAPWLFLCLSPLWPWRKRWAVPAAALIFWQSAVGVYPGLLVAIAYCGLVWVAGWQAVARVPFRSFVGPMLAAGATGVVLSMGKYLPQLGLNSIARVEVPDLTVLNPATLATLVLPPHQGLPGVYSLNLLFVPAAALLLALLADLRLPPVRVAVMTFAVGVFLAVPQNPLRPLLSALPAFDSSRFHLNDYLPVLFTMGVVAAASGIARLTAATPRRWPFAILAFLPLTLAIAALVGGSFREGPWEMTFGVLAGTTLVVVALLLVRAPFARTPWWRTGTTVLVTVLAAFSGIAHAQTVADLWRINTVAAQTGSWGATSGELIRHRAATEPTQQRPARVPLGTSNDPAEYGSVRHNAGVWGGWSSVGGYFSVHESASYVQATSAVTDPQTGGAARAFWAAAGTLVPLDGAGALPPAEVTVRCAETGVCPGATVTPVRYLPGELVYEVEAASPQVLAANEAFYPGWQVLLTDEHGSSVTGRAQLGVAGSTAIEVPAGTWRLSLRYETPLGAEARALFAFGLAFLALPLVVGRALRRRLGPSPTDA